MYLDQNSGATYFGNSSALGSGVLNLGGGVPNNNIDLWAGTPSAGANVVLSNSMTANGGFGIHSENGGNLSFSGNVTLAGTADLQIYSYGTGTKAVTFSGVISSGTLAQALGVFGNNGNGGYQPLILTNPANSYLGVTKAVFGTIIAGANVPATGAAGTGAFGQPAVGNEAILLGDSSAGQGGTYAEPAAILAENGVTIARPITVRAGNAGVASVGGYDNSNLTFSGSIALNKPVTLVSQSTGANAVTFSGVLSDASTTTNTVTVAGPGNIVFSASNTYKAATIVNASSLTLDFTALTPATNVINPLSALTLNGAALNIKGNSGVATSQTFASLTIGGISPTIGVNPNGSSGVTVNLGPITARGQSHARPARQQRHVYQHQYAGQWDCRRLCDGQRNGLAYEHHHRGADLFG